MKRNVLGVLVDDVDPRQATEAILDAARARRPLAATALAVHGLVTAVGDGPLRYRLNHLDLVTADGQPVRWGLNLLHSTRLAERVAGPSLMLSVCHAAADEGLPVYLYGSAPDVLGRLVDRLPKLVPGVQVAGAAPSRFRTLADDERREMARTVEASGARVLFVGLGCPRQEAFVFENRPLLAMPAVAVGAAFDFHAGLRKRPPDLVQRAGLEWAYRLVQEPRRLWRRYATTNVAYLALVGLQAARVWHPSAVASPPASELRPG